MSVPWLDLDLSIDIKCLVLLILGVSTILLDASDLSVLLTISIFFFAGIGGVMDYFTTLGSVLLFFNHVSISLFENCVSSSDQWLFGIIKISTCFSNLFTWIIIFLRQWGNDIGWRYFSAWFSTPC